MITKNKPYTLEKAANLVDDAVGDENFYKAMRVLLRSNRVGTPLVSSTKQIAKKAPIEDLEDIELPQTTDDDPAKA